MVNADIVLLNPARVGTNFATKVLEGVVVNIVLGALIIEVDLLFAMELTVALVLNLGVKDLLEDNLVLSNGASKSNFGEANIFSSLSCRISCVLVFHQPAPVGVITSSSLLHGNSDFGIFKDVEGFIVLLIDYNDFCVDVS